MSIKKVRETGDDLGEPTPLMILELQQLTLGLFLIWDALGDQSYTRKEQEGIEENALNAWANKHHVCREHAIAALVRAKHRFMTEPFAEYIHCRDFQGEGWAEMLAFNPHGNKDVLKQINELLDARPFREKPE